MTQSGHARRPRVSVIIPTYRRPQQVARAVRSLLGQDFPHDDYEVIVVDTSPDNVTTTLIREIAASAPCAVSVHSKQPEGPGPSRNLGALHARGDILAFMDSDCRATPGWLRAGVAAFGDAIGLVQGRTLPDPTQTLGVLKHYVRVEEENAYYEAANIFYLREAFLQAGGFPADRTPLADWPVGGEDSEIAWVVKRSGWASRFAPDAVVHHEVVPVSVRFWLANKRLFWLPAVTRRIPEIRREFFARYFYDRAQAALIVAVLGAALTAATLEASPAVAAACLPYVVVRTAEPSRTLRGPLRLLRALFYLPRDLVSLALLTAGSIRYRTILL